MPGWKPTEATWKNLHREFEKKTEIQDYIVKKKKLKFFKVKASGAKQIGKYLKAVDKAIVAKDVAAAEKALAKFEKTYADWRKQMDKDHLAFKKHLEQMKGGEIDFSAEDLKKAKAAEPAFRLLVANVANLEMAIDNALRDLKGTQPAARKVRFSDE